MLWGAKAKLLPSGPVSLLINGDNDVEVSSGSTPGLPPLGNNKIFLPLCLWRRRDLHPAASARCLEGGGEILPLPEAPHFTRKEIAEGMALGLSGSKSHKTWSSKCPKRYFGFQKMGSYGGQKLECSLFCRRNLWWRYLKLWTTRPGVIFKLKFPNVKSTIAISIFRHILTNIPVNPISSSWNGINLTFGFFGDEKILETVERAYSMASVSR